MGLSPKSVSNAYPQTSDECLTIGRVALLLFLFCCLHSNLVAASPDQSGAQQHMSRGLQLAQNGDLNGAEIELKQALELAPNDPQILAALGGVMGMQQKLKDASPYLAKALELDPNNVMFRRNLAANQWQLGQLPEARKNLEHILKVKPDDRPTIFLLGMVMENLQEY